MRVAVIGAGPAGLLVGSALAGRGHDVVAVDRDPGPPEHGRWARRGVMQFHHAHAFRGQVGEVLRDEWPAALAAWLTLGAEPVTTDQPETAEVPVAFRSRRETFERALHTTALATQRFTLRRGHVDGVRTEHGRATGITVDGSAVDADLVIDATGRSGRAADQVRGPATVGGVCGLAYVDRQYQLKEGCATGPMRNPIAWQADLDGYQSIGVRLFWRDAEMVRYQGVWWSG